MTTYLGKSCSFGLPRVPFVNCRQFMYLVISLLVLRAGCGIWLYQFLIIAYLFTLPTKHAKHIEKMVELTYAELTHLPYTHKLTTLKIKFPVKRKVLPSHPSCNHLRQPIKLSLNFHFPMHWDWLKWFQFWKSWKSWHYWTYCHFCLMSVYDY